MTLMIKSRQSQIKFCLLSLLFIKLGCFIDLKLYTAFIAIFLCFIKHHLVSFSIKSKESQIENGIQARLLVKVLQTQQVIERRIVANFLISRQDLMKELKPIVKKNVSARLCFNNLFNLKLLIIVLKLVKEVGEQKEVSKTTKIRERFFSYFGGICKKKNIQHNLAKKEFKDRLYIKEIRCRETYIFNLLSDLEVSGKEAEIPPRTVSQQLLAYFSMLQSKDKRINSGIEEKENIQTNIKSKQLNAYNSTTDPSSQIFRKIQVKQTRRIKSYRQLILHLESEVIVKLSNSGQLIYQNYAQECFRDQVLSPRM